MKIKIVSPATAIVQNSDSLHSYFAWPTVSRLPDGRLATVCSGFRLGHICPFGKAVISYSSDEGKSWSAPAPVIDTLLDDRDAGIAASENGTVMFTSFNNSIAQQRNWNNNSKRSPESKAYISSYLDKLEGMNAEEKYLGSTYKLSRDGGTTFGEVLRSPVTAPHGPAPYKDGFLYVGRRISQYLGQVDTLPALACYYVDENGEMTFISYIPDVELPNVKEICEPHTLVLPDGKIVVHIRVQGDGLFTTFQTVSVDGGKSFSQPTPLFEEPKGGAPAHLLRLRDGRVISSYGYRNAPYGIKAMVSGDGCESWQMLGYLFDQGDSLDIGYPASVELDDGNILTVFYGYDKNYGTSVIKQIIWRLED